MPKTMWLVLAGGAIGAAIAIYGLVTRPKNRRSGSYALFFGAGLVLLALSNLLNAFDLTVPALLVLAASLTLAGVAVFRYRPRADADRRH